MLSHKLLDGLAYFLLHKDEVRDRDVMMRVDISGQRGEGPVRHADRDGRHVLE
jgi:uncharacterized phosphosugar-binding protein